MYPKNSNILFKKISEQLNCNEELVSDYIHFVFSSLRKEMSELKEINYCIPYIGRFDTKVNLLQKEIERYRKLRKDGDLIPEEEQQIYNSLDKTMEEVERYEQIKLKKLEWHKENGNPFGKYSKEQEENIKRNKELRDKKKSYRKNFQKKNEDV